MGLFRLFPPGFKIGDEAGDEKEGRPVGRQPPGRRWGRHGSSYSGFPACPWTALRLLGWRYPRAPDQSRGMIARSSPSSNSISRPSGSRQDLSNLAGPSRPDERAESARCSRWLTTRRMGEDARGCVKTCTSEERVALFSLLSFPIAVVSVFILQNHEIEKDFLRAV